MFTPFRRLVGRCLVAPLLGGVSGLCLVSRRRFARGVRGVDAVDGTLCELGAQAPIDGGNGLSFGILHATEQATARDLDDQLTAAWKRVEKLSLRRHVRTARPSAAPGAVVLTGRLGHE